MNEMLNQLFDDKMKAHALNIAMAIETGTIDYDLVLNTLESMPDSRFLIMFWATFNDMTKNALDRLYDYASRKHLEKCWEL